MQRSPVQRLGGGNVFDLEELTDRSLIVPYLAAAWTAVIILILTVIVSNVTQATSDPQVLLWFRVGGGWLALLTGAFVWVMISEPIRLRRKVNEATQKLQESEERFRALYEEAPLAYLTLDEEGTITRTNERVSELLGYEPGELEGRSILGLFKEGPEGVDRAQDLVTKFKEGETAQGAELAMETAAGETVWVTFTVRPIGQRDDTGTTTLSMVLDITERKRAEDQLEYYASELERSNEDLQQFAYVVSHDLQEPIRTIRSYLQLLERRYGEQLDEDADEFIEYAVDGADRMEALIKGLLGYSRVGTQAQPAEPVDLATLVDDIKHDLAIAIQESDATIETTDLPTVEGDPSQLRQLLQNLVSNAIKYAGPEEPTIRIEAEQIDEAWQIAVEDDGPGIPEDERENVFDVFHRVGARPDKSGTGMGLAIARRIVERHGGSIHVEEGTLGGARFVFTLPKGGKKMQEAPIQTPASQASPEDA